MNIDELGSVGEAAEAYFDLRERMIDLLRSCDESGGAVRVPHCPAWTVEMTVSHMLGVPESVLSGDMSDVTSDAWTARQVERHRGRSLAELADLWEEQSSTFDEVCRSIPQPTVSQFVFDQVTHEHDVRWALQRSGARDSAAVSVGARWIVMACGPKLSVPAGLNDFEILRCLSGRRSLAELEHLGFDGREVEASLDKMPLSIPADRVGD